MRAAPPLPKSLLISSYQHQKHWPKISVTYFTKRFHSIFTFGGWRIYPLNLPLLAPAYIPTHSCKRASLWSLSPAGARNYKPEPDSSPTFIFEAPLRPESQIYRGSQDMRNCGVTKKVVFGYSCRYAVYHTQNNNHLDQNIGIIWHKRSMLVNDNTAEYKCFSTKKEIITRLSTMVLSAWQAGL